MDRGWIWAPNGGSWRCLCHRRWALWWIEVRPLTAFIIFKGGQNVFEPVPWLRRMAISISHKHLFGCSRILTRIRSAVLVDTHLFGCSRTLTRVGSAARCSSSLGPGSPSLSHSLILAFSLSLTHTLSLWGRSGAFTGLAFWEGAARANERTTRPGLTQAGSGWFFHLLGRVSALPT